MDPGNPLPKTRDPVSMNEGIIEYSSAFCRLKEEAVMVTGEAMPVLNCCHGYLEVGESM